MAVSTTPAGYHTLTTYLSVRNGVKAIEFYKTVFGAVEEMRMAMPNGALAHAELKIGDSHIMLADENLEWGNKGPETLGPSGWPSTSPTVMRCSRKLSPPVPR